MLKFGNTLNSFTFEVIGVVAAEVNKRDTGATFSGVNQLILTNRVQFLSIGGKLLNDLMMLAGLHYQPSAVVSL